MRYRDRAEAGRVLAEALGHLRGRGDVLVLGLARGGVPVAAEVAKALGARLDVLLVRKLGLPGDEELAMGAIASGGVLVRNQAVLHAYAISDEELATVARREQEELARRELLYRGHRAPPTVAGHVVLLVDDGLATGASMRAAVAATRQQEPARLIVAVPVAAPAACDALAPLVDELVCPWRPDWFRSVGGSYFDFASVSDEELRRLLAPPEAADQGAGW